MPEVIQDKPNRKPQWIALAVAVLVIVGIVAAVIVMQVTSNQKKAFETAKSSAISSDKHGDYKKAASTLQAYLDTNPPKKYADQIYVSTAAAYLNAENYPKAIEMYKKADSVDPKNHVLALSGLALAYGYKGDKETAIGYYNQLIEITKKANAPDAKVDIENYNTEIRNLREGTRNPSGGSI